MIYCIEDDDGIRDLMVYTLKASGYEAQGFAHPKDFWRALQEQTPELILLDIMLPDEDGLSILKKLRSRVDTASLPIIMATAKGTEFDTVLALDQGADDYLAKPFGMMEMVSRVKAVLRRSKSGQSPRLASGPIEMDQNSHQVFANGELIPLTLKEYELLRLFLSHPRQVFSREQLMRTVWGTDFIGETRTVDVHIGTLRTKLRDASLIETVRGVGYKWSAPYDQ